MSEWGVGSWIRRRAQRSPENTALIFGDGQMTYAELAGRVDRLAASIFSLGIRKGDRVAFLGGNHPLFVESLFAVAGLGAVLVPINNRLSPREVQFILADSGATILVHTAALAELAIAGADGGALTHRIIEGTGSGTAETGGPPEVPLEDLLESEGTSWELAAEDMFGPANSLEDPVAFLYTSGTTGRPKGAVLTHANLTWHTLNVLVDYDLGVETVSLPIAPVFHVNSLMMCVLPTLIKGGTLVLQERFDAGSALQLVERHAVSLLSAAPTTLQMLAEHPDWEETAVESVSILMCGGSAIPERVREAVARRGINYTGGYGLTEASAGVSAVPAVGARQPGSSGLPHMFTALRIRDVNGGSAAPGVVAEVQVSSPTVFAGYWNLPDSTEEAVTGDGWLRTGDLGVLDEDGHLHVTGRMKDMIVSGGENIYPAEIEQLIMEMDVVQSVAVIPVDDDRWGEVPKAVVVPTDGASCSLEEIRTHLDGRLARYKLPKYYAELDDLPRTSSGKVRKDQLER